MGAGETKFDFVFYANSRSPTPIPDRHSLKSLYGEVFLGKTDPEKPDEPPKPDAKKPDEYQRTNCDCGVTPNKKCPEKDALAFSPVELLPGKNRSNGAVLRMTFFVADLDHLSMSELHAVGDRIEGHAFILASTHSSHPPDDCGARLILALSRPLEASEIKLGRAAIIKRFGLPCDPATKDASRLYYIFSPPRGGDPFCIYEDGKAIDVDELMKTARIESTPGLGRPVLPPPREEFPPKPAESVDLKKLRQQIVHWRPKHDDPDGEQKLQWVRRFLAREPLSEEGSRSNAINTLMWILAVRLPLNTPVEAALELVRESVATLPGDEGPDHWMGVARRSWESAHETTVGSEQERLDSVRRMLEGRAKRHLVAEGKTETEAEKIIAADPEQARELLRASSEERAEVEPCGWEYQLVRRTNRDGKVSLAQHQTNIGVILESSLLWKGKFRFNTITKHVEYTGSLLKGDLGTDNLHVALNDWLTKSAWEFNLSPNDAKAQLYRVACGNKYDPLSEYLTGCVGDGKARLNTFLERYFGVQTNSPVYGDITEYVRKVSRRWLLSAVARGLDPGCKVDTVLILEGEQGSKKTSALEALGGGWFANSQLVLGDKDSRLMAAQSWVIELAELVSLRRSNIETLKSFLTERNDRFRPPYASAMEIFPRRCVFAGTTNDSSYLLDVTGNRRFWPVRCVGEIDLPGLLRDRDLLWAEAVAVYRASMDCAECGAGPESRCEDHRWWFTKEESMLVSQQTDKRMRPPAGTEAVRKWWLGMPPEKRPESVKPFDVAFALGKNTADIDDRIEERIAQALIYLGFEARHMPDAGGHSWVYFPSEELRSFPVTGSSERPYLRRVALAAPANVGGQPLPPAAPAALMSVPPARDPETPKEG